LYIHGFKKNTGATSGKREAKRNFTVSAKIPKGTEKKAALKCTSGMAHLHGLVR
jgi:hypothetical protein